MERSKEQRSLDWIRLIANKYFKEPYDSEMEPSGVKLVCNMCFRQEICLCNENAVYNFHSVVLYCHACYEQKDFSESSEEDESGPDQ